MGHICPEALNDKTSIISTLSEQQNELHEAQHQALATVLQNGVTPPTLSYLGYLEDDLVFVFP